MKSEIQVWKEEVVHVNQGWNSSLKLFHQYIYIAVIVMHLEPMVIDVSSDMMYFHVVWTELILFNAVW